MNPYLAFILAGLIIFAANFVAAVTGFGSGVLGVPLLALIVGLDVSKQSMLILSTLLFIYILICWHDHIDWRQLAIMLLFAAAGIPLGQHLYHALRPSIAAIMLGSFVILVGVRNLLNLWPDQRMPRWMAVILLLVGGAVHGAFTTGGPVLTVYADQTLKAKSTFRSTLCVLWVALNILLAISWTRTREWQPASFRLSLIAAPFMIAGLVIGEHIHHAVSERTFRFGVNVTLLVIGAFLIARNV